MKTMQRLDDAFRSAHVLGFDNNSKFIIFSDVHRGDNSMSDEFAHNQSIYLHALKYYYNNQYCYIEAGDGDELWEHAKFSDIRRAHGDIYGILSKFYKEKRLEVLYGNHNIFLKNQTFVEKHLYKFYDEYTDKTMDLFPAIKVHESVILKHHHTGQEIFIVHGHQGDFINDQFWRVSMFMLRYFWRFMHIIGFRNPSSPAKNVVKRHKIEKNFNKWNQSTGIMMICGHTHRPKFPTKDDLPYINSGCCVHPRGITGIEIVNDMVMMIDWRVRPDEKGVLIIERKVIRGPIPIDYYERKDEVAFADENKNHEYESDSDNFSNNNEMTELDDF